MDVNDICNYALYSRIKDLPEIERRIATLIVERLHDGLREYGPWGRREHNNAQDILEEMLDGMVYSAAAAIDLIDKKGSTDD